MKSNVLRIFLCVLIIPGLGLAAWGAFAPYQDETGGAAEDARFLQKLIGTWRMEGRGRYAPEANWYRTASTMVAKLRLKDRAIIREVDAPAIKMEAMDVIWFDPKAKEYTYIYMASNQPQPFVFRGKRTGENEITVYDSSSQSRTVIRLINDNQMVAQDYRKKEDGSEWMSRDVMHYREK